MNIISKDNSQECFPIVDERGTVIGSILRGDAHNGSKTLHPVVHLHLFNSKGELFLQRRPEWKEIQPGKWDTACGGHIDYGESPEEALLREVREELGVTDYTPRRIDMYVHENDIERELVYVHTTVYDGDVHPDDRELDGGRFWTKEDIARNLGLGIFTPNFEEEYRRYFLSCEL